MNDEKVSKFQAFVLELKEDFSLRDAFVADPASLCSTRGIDLEEFGREVLQFDVVATENLGERLNAFFDPKLDPSTCAQAGRDICTLRSHFYKNAYR